MNISISREWIRKKAKEEEGFDIAAGRPNQTSDESLRCFAGDDSDAAEHLAFGALIEFLRRAQKLSALQLAEAAEIDVAEIIRIEVDVRFMPRPRTVHQLAKFFGLPEKRLLELSNLTTVHTPEIREAAVRFAANAKKVTELDRAEREALNEFVKVLSSR